MQVKEEWIGNNITCPTCQEEIFITAPSSTAFKPQQQIPIQPAPLPEMPRTCKAPLVSREILNDPLPILGKASCVLMALLTAIALIIGISTGLRIRSAVNEAKEIQQQETDEYAELNKQRIALSGQYSTMNYSEYRRKMDEIDKKTDQCDEKYSALRKDHRQKYAELLNTTGTDWESFVTTSIFGGLLILIFCGINNRLFPVCAASIATTPSVVSSLSLIRIIQLVFVAVSLVFFWLGFAIDNFIIFYVFAVWMAAVAAALCKPDRFAIKEEKQASPVQDIAAWITLPLKVSLYLLPVFFALGALFLIYLLCKNAPLVSAFFISAIAVSLLPLINYLFYLTQVYFLEIGSAIVAIPQLLKNKK
ncbi:MAG: hypothetical protein E7058_08630 [Lentisphaerae bacterium]|nr:hypothetical protein [Lentisphaerota bacterium]